MHVLQNAFYGKFAGEFFQIKIQIQGQPLSAQRFSYKIHPSAKLMLFSLVSFWSKGSPMKIILSFLFATALAKVRISQTHSNTSQLSKLMLILTKSTLMQCLTTGVSSFKEGTQLRRAGAGLL